MKTILNIVFLLLFFSGSAFPQYKTFDKDFPTLGSNSEGYIVKQTLNGDYIIGGIADSSLLIVKTDSIGNMIFSRQFEKSSVPDDLRTFPVNITRDGGLIITSGKPSTIGSDLFLTKLDADGNMVWEKTYQDTQFVFGSDVVETDYGDFIAIGYVELNIVSLTKTDSDGNFIWSKTIKFNPVTQLLKGPMLTKLTDGNFLLANDRVLQKFTADGDSLWQINSGFKVSSIKQTRFGRMIAAGYRKFAVINLDGTVEFEQSLGFTVDAGENTLDNGFIFLANGNTIIKTDSLGVIEWEKNVIGTGNFIVSTSDGGYAATGNYLDNLRLLKTDNAGEFETLYITNPKQFNHLAIFSEFNIKWYSNGVENVDIEYSIDNGANWLEVVSNYPADSSKYSWVVPNTSSDNCNLIISASNNSNIFYILDTVFTIMAIQNYDYIAVNECKMWIGNNGMSAHNPITDDSGFYWPGGENATISSIFTDGILWGGIHQGMIKVNGATFRYGLQPGQILENGKADNPNQSKYKIFKINKNWESMPDGLLKDKLEYDYNNWPGNLGATYIDVNNDGIFTKGIDKPDFIGDEVLFYVANDLDSFRTAFTYGSPPIGLEFQQTLFAYNTPELKDAVFKKVKLINRSNSTIDSMYISYWTDDDLGNAHDDFVGCDTTLNLCYIYNADNDDEDYYGPAPPAVGHLLLQGPIEVSKQEDSAKFNGKTLFGYKNLPMSSFNLINKSSTYNDVSFGVYEGTIEFYNNMKGLIWNGDPYIDPNTDKTTKFCVPGDPVNGIGWYEGEGWPNSPYSGDRRHVINSGPFTMAPGDTQEVVYAIFMAKGSDNIQSVAELKKSARLLHEFWGNDIPVNISEKNVVLPTKFSLSQNYPNPFNPTTTIKYSIPSNTVIAGNLPASDVGTKQSNEIASVNSFRRNDNVNVTLIVYDILGRKVKTLVNQKQAPGNYEVEFNAIKLASGMYFYRLSVADNVAVKKMMLLK